jgi:hypothetical protein
VVFLRGLLIGIGWLLMALALVVLVLGLVEVGKGEKGTWQIWPYYLIHGGVSLIALVLFGVANAGRERIEASAEMEGGS